VTLASQEAERAELHKTIWRIANDLRGSVDGSDFKSYVLGMRFYRSISENRYRRRVRSSLDGR
jgi:type I restriction enzyme M protein